MRLRKLPKSFHIENSRKKKKKDLKKPASSTDVHIIHNIVTQRSVCGQEILVSIGNKLDECRTQ